jgi:DNA polymerase-1
MQAELEAHRLGKLFREIELPLISILAALEHVGVGVQLQVLDELAEEFTTGIERLTNEINELAGRKFNINSTQQLGQILFEELGYPVIEKTKTGYSTAASVLEVLAVEHDAELARKVMEYRELVKLQSTYVEGLRAQVDPETGRIHTTFNQTVAATGRLSSTEPNLQNIPVRTQLGRRIRRVFAAEGGRRLVAADYSQIELRVLAQI